jgi:hypothetical protein
MFGITYARYLGVPSTLNLSVFLYMDNEGQRSLINDTNTRQLEMQPEL